MNAILTVQMTEMLYSQGLSLRGTLSRSMGQTPGCTAPAPGSPRHSSGVHLFRCVLGPIAVLWCTKQSLISSRLEHMFHCCNFLLKGFNSLFLFKIQQSIWKNKTSAPNLPSNEHLASLLLRRKNYFILRFL